jgi:hypothetical protein
MNQLNLNMFHLTTVKTLIKVHKSFFAMAELAAIDSSDSQSREM